MHCHIYIHTTLKESITLILFSLCSTLRGSIIVTSISFCTTLRESIVITLLSFSKKPDVSPDSMVKSRWSLPEGPHEYYACKVVIMKIIYCLFNSVWILAIRGFTATFQVIVKLTVAVEIFGHVKMVCCKVCSQEDEVIRIYFSFLQQLLLWIRSNSIFVVLIKKATGWPTHPENPRRPWKTLDCPCPWKTLKLQPTPEKLCSEADFRVKIFGLAVLLRFWFGVDYVSSLLIGMDSEETIDGHTGGFRGVRHPQCFPCL